MTTSIYLIGYTGKNGNKTIVSNKQFTTYEEARDSKYELQHKYKHYLEVFIFDVEQPEQPKFKDTLFCKIMSEMTEQEVSDLSSALSKAEDLLRKNSCCTKDEEWWTMIGKDDYLLNIWAGAIESSKVWWNKFRKQQVTAQ